MIKKIVFFDSGIGGLSTLACCLSINPTLKYTYIADNKNAPYGKLSQNKVCKLTLTTLEPFISSKETSAIVLACNTATTCSIEKLREKALIPIIGIEPAIIPAVKFTKHKILVLATPATVMQPKFERLCNPYLAQLIISPQQNLATLIEKYYENKCNETLTNLTNELLKIKNSNQKVDAVVLGCTHYSLISKLISEIFGVKVFDGNLGVANELYRIINPRENVSAKSFPQIITTKPTKTNYSKILTEQLNLLQNQ